MNSFHAKKDEKQVIFITPKTTVESTLQSVNLFDGKTIKNRLNSLQPSSSAKKIVIIQTEM